MPTITLKRGEFQGYEVIWVHFKYHQGLIDALKRQGLARWSQVSKAWYIVADDFRLHDFVVSYKSLAYIDYRDISGKTVYKPAQEKAKVVRTTRKPVHPKNLPLLTQFRDWMEHKRYSRSSVKTYLDALGSFLGYIGERDLKTVGNEDVINYIKHHILPQGLSYSFQNQAISAIKLFFSEVVRSRIEIERLERPRREHKLPNVLSPEEVGCILNALQNTKHRAMLCLIYACGLRRSELLNLKIPDVDAKRMILIIRSAKGKRDRIVPISGRILEVLRAYYRESVRKPREWLFEGQKAGERYSEQSLTKVLKNALYLSGIKRPVTLHWLRHSYATHLLESGTDLRYIQELLGHKSSRTTEIYTHVSSKQIQKIRSPFDDLDVGI